MEPGEISHHNLEDPAIFPDLVDTGLLKLDGCLTIGQCLGATLKEVSDSLTPLTAEIVDNISSRGSSCRSSSTGSSSACRHTDDIRRRSR